MMQFDDPRAEAVLQEYVARHREENARMKLLPAGDMLASRDEFLLPVGEEVGAFLHAFIIGRVPNLILELGTSFGYSTLFLADAARLCGARVISMDLDGSKQDYARAMLEKAGLEQYVEFRCGDAVELVKIDSEPIDFALLDIWKDAYVACFEAVYPRLSEEAVVITDNMITPESARPNARALRDAIHSKGDLQTALLPIGQGIELTVKWSAENPKL